MTGKEGTSLGVRVEVGGVIAFVSKFAWGVVHFKLRDQV